MACPVGRIVLVPQPLLSFSASSRPRKLRDNISLLIHEASSLIACVLPDKDSDNPPGTGWRSLGTKRPLGRKGGIVEIFRTSIAHGNRKGEDWSARRSVHANSTEEDGGITWEEFEDGLLRNHVKNGLEYQDTMKHVEVIKSYTVENEQTSDVTDISCEVCLVTHAFPTPLSPRTFPILVITAYTGSNCFFVLSIPVSGWEELAPHVPMEGIEGRYASVERVRIIPSGQIEWTTASSSAVGGLMPAWVLKLKVPGTMAGKVGSFLRWVQWKRGEKDKKRTEGSENESSVDHASV